MTEDDKPDNRRWNATEGNRKEMRYAESWDDRTLQIVSKKGVWQGLTQESRGRQKNGKEEKITEKRMQPQKRDIYNIKQGFEK